MSAPTSLTTTRLWRLLSLANGFMRASDLKTIEVLLGAALHDIVPAQGMVWLKGTHSHTRVMTYDSNGYIDLQCGLPSVVTLAKRVSEQQISLLIGDTSPLISEQYADLHVHGVKSLLAVPVVSNSLRGSIVLFWDTTQQNKTLKHGFFLLQHIAELTASALIDLESKQVLEQRITDNSSELSSLIQEHSDSNTRRDQEESLIREQSVTDALTGLLNRRGFLLHADKGLRIAKRLGATCTLVYADVDGLKNVNDKQGHHTGDLLIQQAAKAFLNSFRESDVVGRLGGDEFAALSLHDSSPETILDRIKQQVMKTNTQLNAPLQLALSIGIVRCNPDSGLSLSDQLERADKHMYTQKQSHRQTALQRFTTRLFHKTHHH